MPRGHALEELAYFAFHGEVDVRYDVSVTLQADVGRRRVPDDVVTESYSLLGDPR